MPAPARHYPAPWSKALIVISGLATAICLAVSFALAKYGGGRLGWFGPILIAVSLIFVVRGYAVTPEAVLVRRPLWSNRLPRAGLESVRFEPDAMRRSTRLFGNGGFFSFTGIFRNGKLGTYRAFATDMRRTVVLRYSGRTVVVSPGAPEEFVRDLASP